jgi:hypothetical protein
MGTALTIRHLSTKIRCNLPVINAHYEPVKYGAYVP